MTDKNARSLSKKDLVRIVNRLEEENERLRTKLAMSKKDSSTSGKPPSSNIVKPPGTPTGKKKGKVRIPASSNTCSGISRTAIPVWLEHSFRCARTVVTPAAEPGTGRVAEGEYTGSSPRGNAALGSGPGEPLHAGPFG